MSFEAHQKGLVIGVDHFFDKNDELKILPELVSDEEFSQHITGIWIPKSTFDNNHQARKAAELAQGSPLMFNRYTKPSDHSLETRLIWDLSSSGGVADTIGHIIQIVRLYPAQHTVFTVSLNGFAEVFEATEKLKSQFEHNNNPEKNIFNSIDFLLATAYPENNPIKFEKVMRTSQEEYTAHISAVADEYGMLGVVGAADLAHCTRVGQYFLALGVCCNGAVNYEVETDIPGYSITKRLTSPEETYKHARNTEAQVGRTLFDDGEGNVVFVNQAKEEQIDIIKETVRNNLATIIGRLGALPEPVPLPIEISALLEKYAS